MKNLDARKPGVPPVIRKLDAALRELKATRRQRFLIGVSGGRDSVALLHALVDDLGFSKLVVCHLDHGLRGRASGADARFAERLAEKLRLDFVGEKADVPRLAAERKLSVETAGRQARHEFFARTAREKKCRALFLAHHANDQAETFLFNLFRGAGSAGLGAMRPDSTRLIAKTPLRILRPLLGVWREEIDEYLAARGLKFREDATNYTLENSRSVMRHRILPMIAEAFGRGVEPALWRAAELFSAQHEWLEKSLRGEKSGALSVPALRALPEALQRFAVHRWLKARAVPDVSFALVENVRALLPPGAPRAKVNLPGARHVRRREKILFVE